MLNKNTMEIVKVDIVFRKDKDGVFALFPHDCADHKGNVTSYQHVGQHSSADYNHCITNSKPATAEQYTDLKAEMESIGYEITVVKKRNYDKFLKSYKKVW